MTPSLTPRPDCPLEPTTAAKATSTQLLGVLYITLTGLMDSMVPNSGPWSLLGQSVSYIIKLAPIIWRALPADSVAPHPKPPNASTYDWLPDIQDTQDYAQALQTHYVASFALLLVVTLVELFFIACNFKNFANL
ncbi:hypothetical protein DSO57_1000320 [Entomophthora muscae]|uniref:Uncharacterized protein n=1 Tax=Entomophthora muscae TaxID=34485 RepID=A0ACC2TKL7_9FUNG|nr:hypothetical protein DSO57_1000320 [Entomophthora muscae]